MYKFAALFLSIVAGAGAVAAQTCDLDLAHPIVIPRKPERTLPSVTTNRDAAVSKTPADTLKHAYKLGDGTVVFLGRFEIDADGSPHAYAPADKGLDATANAGHSGKWFALATDRQDCGPAGQPLIQGDDDVAPGYYVSRTTMTSGESCRKSSSYVDSETIPYVALPPAIATAACQGRFVAVAESEHVEMALNADDAPRYGMGEGSIALAKSLGIDSNPRNGGIDDRRLVYVVLPRHMGFPSDADEIRKNGHTAFEKWGGTARLNACRKALEKAQP